MAVNAAHQINITSELYRRKSYLWHGDLRLAGNGTPGKAEPTRAFLRPTPKDYDGMDIFERCRQDFLVAQRALGWAQVLEVERCRIRGEERTARIMQTMAKERRERAERRKRAEGYSGAGLD
ncbi:hypothetical protein BAUCODRAFT_219815 [Baudoinia panamericana UAMH 10762]|uniref:Uncharacterized protein n=1 Tax=Baudoinia panamericana (strain UAMH 10762) TaxID=717646 RepID=M2N4W8_BAUPA|nr:uncharacterized protein BAUCODRAFT_219815 [Baudoinia panamericana UAMH 10762]EMC94059.1 hypothetical protein BAUCODRAFT_219815 [Baudoinia panamericana UAMH 10762]